MEDLIISGNRKTPYFKLLTCGKLEIGGVSFPEDAANFYFPIIDWFSDYYRCPAPNTHLRVSFKYLNSTSSCMVHKMFYLLNRLAETKKTLITCEWIYEKDDLDMFDYARKIEDITPAFEIIIGAKEDIF